MYVYGLSSIHCTHATTDIIESHATHVYTLHWNFAKKYWNLISHATTCTCKHIHRLYTCSCSIHNAIHLLCMSMYIHLLYTTVTKLHHTILKALTSCSMYSLQYRPDVGNWVTSRSYSMRARSRDVVYMGNEDIKNVVTSKIMSCWCLVNFKSQVLYHLWRGGGGGVLDYLTTLATISPPPQVMSSQYLRFSMQAFSMKACHPYVHALYKWMWLRHEHSRIPGESHTQPQKALCHNIRPDWPEVSRGCSEIHGMCRVTILHTCAHWIDMVY